MRTSHREKNISDDPDGSNARDDSNKRVADDEADDSKAKGGRESSSETTAAEEGAPGPRLEPLELLEPQQHFPKNLTFICGNVTDNPSASLAHKLAEFDNPNNPNSPENSGSKPRSSDQERDRERERSQEKVPGSVDPNSPNSPNSPCGGSALPLLRSRFDVVCIYPKNPNNPNSPNNPCNTS